MAALAKVLAELQLQDYLEQRTKQLSSWAERGSVARLEPEEECKSANLTSALVPLVTTRLLCAEDWRALSATCPAHCARLGKWEAMRPLLDLLRGGFYTIRGLSDDATVTLQRLDEEMHSVRVRLERVTKAELVALKNEVQSDLLVRPALCRPVLELASHLLQPNEKAHDDFAVRRLGSDLRVADRAIACGPLKLSSFTQA